MRIVKIAKDLPSTFWDIVEQFLPKYHSSQEVNENDLLQRYADNELVAPDDRGHIDWVESLEGTPQEELDASNLALYNEAVESFNLKYVNVPENNVAFTASTICAKLLDQIRRSGGVMAAHETIAIQALIFIDKHEEIEKAGTWQEFCEKLGFSGWEEYLIHSVQTNLDLK